MASIAPLEIQALSKIMDELDYYQLLHLKAGASSTEIRRAYHATSRTFHPDANRSLEEGLREQCSNISKRVTEAYIVLRDPRRRKAYDHHLASGDGLRMQLAEARAAHAKQESEQRTGRTAQGKQFYQKATAAERAGDLATAHQHLQMALTFESDNALFKEELARLKVAREAERKAKK